MSERARSSLSAEVVRGRNGWLLLGHDANQLMRQQVGELQLSDEELRSWRYLLETRSSWLAKRGIPYLFLIPPVPHAVYPDMLPDGLRSSDRRPVMQLLEGLERSGSSVRPIYPLAELRAARADRDVYVQTDTRWNDYGAFIAYQRLADELARKGVELRRLTGGDFALDEEMATGNLGRALEPPVSSPHLTAKVTRPAARTVSDNLVVNRGRLIVYESAAAASKCVVFGDSYAYGMLPFLSESFGRLVFAHLPTLDFDLIDEHQPDVVVSVLNEGFLAIVPYDLPKRSYREIEREKKGAERVLKNG